MRSLNEPLIHKEQCHGLCILKMTKLLITNDEISSKVKVHRLRSVSIFSILNHPIQRWFVRCQNNSNNLKCLVKPSSSKIMWNKMPKKMKITCITPADTEISCGLKVDGLITFDSSSCCLFGASVSSHLLENVFELESIANMFYLQFHVVFYWFYSI